MTRIYKNVCPLKMYCPGLEPLHQPFSWFTRLLNYLVSNLSTLSEPDEGYSRNAICTLNLLDLQFYVYVL